MRIARRLARLSFVQIAIAAACVTFLVTVPIMVMVTVASDQKSDGGKPWVPSTLTAEDRASLFQSGSTWKGKGETQGISRYEAESFSAYPLYWLGESFAGYNLQAIVHQQFTPSDGIPAHEAIDAVVLIYGDCTILEGSDACPAPISIMIEPGCAKRPELIEPGMLTGTLEIVRGNAQLLRFRDQHVRLWTGSVSVSIDATADHSLVDRIVQELAGLNRINTLGPGDALPAPDLADCPPIQIPPTRGAPPELP